VIAPVPYECKHIHRAKQFVLELAVVIEAEEKQREKYKNAPDI
jgi:hypothetical protein